MKKPYTHLLVACLVLMAMQCRTKTPKPTNPIDQLPPATQTGEGTFGCLVNGEAWVTKSFTDAPTFYQQGVLSIGATIKGNGKDQTIGLDIIDNELTTKKYTLTTNVEATAYFQEFSPPPESCLLFLR